jgi:hypothetical protein
MNRGSYRDFRPSRHFRRNSELGPGEVQPYARGGVGILTGHPVGLVVIAGVILLTMEHVPAARWFFGGSLVVGGAIGFALWLHHR